ncbi:hypothetical protein H5410_057459 [Solanum commersonii]|uniref:Uncharacterized protein n=1 Tax=Solanum commersonii TaxID=4109 RepID=A0A9J5WPR9_SOLCO|nr:hypothetical protein H5410_057459 [Solanum commersonii]
MIIKQIISIEDWGISSMKESAFKKVLYYNNETHKNTWFIKVCSKFFFDPIPNWFLIWWSYHGPTVKILPDPFSKLYKNWVKVSLELNDLYHSTCFTEEQIPCLYRIYYNNFWEKLMKNDLMTKSLYGQELLDPISQKIQDYGTIPHKGIIANNSIKHIARRISIQDGNKE